MTLTNLGRIAIAILVAAWVTTTSTREVQAYPQFQLSREQTCTGCHLSPSGGGLLNENGTTIAETLSQFGHNGEFMYGKVPTPEWLVLGGDLRAAGGYFQTPFRSLGAFPMQGDLYARAMTGAFSLHVTGGFRPAQEGNESATRLWSREHYVQWQQDPGQHGLFARVGRFMPVFGLRFAEHPIYTRRYGGTQLYAETYGAALEYIDPKFELHATGFIRDRLIDPAVHDSGGAFYGEYRITEKLAIGAESMVTASKDDRKYRGGLTGKLYLPTPDLLLQAEVIVTHQDIENVDRNINTLTAYLMASYFLKDWLMIDVGVGTHDENIQVKNLYRDAADLNLHWFATSHLEVLLTSRIELLAFGAGGPTGAYSLLQLHYRL